MTDDETIHGHEMRKFWKLLGSSLVVVRCPECERRVTVVPGGFLVNHRIRDEEDAPRCPGSAKRPHEEWE